jgi:hypothetical protein
MHDDGERRIQENESSAGNGPKFGSVDAHDLAERVYELMMREIRLEQARTGH